MPVVEGDRPGRRSAKKVYADADDILTDEALFGQRTWDLEERLASPRYNDKLVARLTPADLTYEYVQRTGLSQPLLLAEYKGLGMRVPSSMFTVQDVRSGVGSRREVEIVDVATQQGATMSMKEFCDYYESPEREEKYRRLLNCLSLEYSHTRLSSYVEPPAIVRQLDWVDAVWPAYLKQMQRDGTNSLNTMLYPKVQRYVLMSPARCWTDFHLDFGGTSVWYHIVRGEKIFFVVPPRPENLKLYEDWTLGGRQSDYFLADYASACERVHLRAGDTFMLPCGYIHAVYTPADSIVFGGNFIHSFQIPMQLKVQQIEDRTRVPAKFRFPFFTEICWLAAARYCYILTGVSFLTALDTSVLGEADSNVRPLTDETKYTPKLKIHLPTLEREGLESLVKWLQQQAPSTVPSRLADSANLLATLSNSLAAHKGDDQQLALTGVPLLRGFEALPRARKVKAEPQSVPSSQPPLCKTKQLAEPTVLEPMARKRRRGKCAQCEPCVRPDCGECIYCLDMPKFGGPGKAKQTCLGKKCMRPILSNKVFCAVCELVDREVEKTPLLVGQENTPDTGGLLECEACFTLLHARCYLSTHSEPLTSAVLSWDVPNSWLCPLCSVAGKRSKVKYIGITCPRPEAGSSRSPAPPPPEVKPAPLGRKRRSTNDN